MKSYDELKAEMESIQQQMVEVNKSELASALKESKFMFKEFGFNAGMVKGSIADCRKNK
jgi:hypothetical protein|tara:strand:- start:1710 stop:1886 length:177 start_codon:yes stop_codon:yes gene_type:complete